MRLPLLHPQPLQRRLPPCLRLHLHPHLWLHVWLSLLRRLLPLRPLLHLLLRVQLHLLPLSLPRQRRRRSQWQQLQPSSLHRLHPRLLLIVPPTAQLLMPHPVPLLRLR